MPVRRWFPQGLRLGLVVGLLAALLPAAGAALATAGDPAAPTEVNASPVAVDDNLVAFTDEGYQDLYILDNDTDADGDNLILQAVQPAQHGAAACCSSVGAFEYAVYKPNAGYSGPDQFTYTVTDQHGHTDTGLVHVTVGSSGQVSNARVAIHGGPQDRLTVIVSPKAGGPTNANAGACDENADGLGIEDVVIEPGNSTYFDAFDNGLTFFINGNQLGPHFPFSVTHDNLASGPQTVDGLQFGLAYFGVRESFTLRTLLSVTNNSGVSKPVTITLATNVGSDALTGIRGTSDGDATFETGDRWIVTSSDPTNPGLIVDTHVLFGPGAAVTPDLVSTTVFNCSGDQGIRARFRFSVPANSTRRLLFFNQFHNGNEAALTDVTEFDHTPVAMLQGLTNNQLDDVVNWNIPQIERVYVPQTEK